MKNKKIVPIILVAVFILGFLFYSGVFQSAKPSVILHVTQSSTEILGFTYAKYPGTMQCIACVGFSGKVKIFHEGVLICEESEFFINFGEEAIINVRCEKDIIQYENKTVLVQATGSIAPAGSSPFVSKDTKSLIMKFNKKW